MESAQGLILEEAECPFLGDSGHSLIPGSWMEKRILHPHPLA
jgi:hypothetical protein